MVQAWIQADELDNPADPNAADAIAAASHILWELSGRRWNGVRSVTEVYAQIAPPEPDNELFPATPYLDRGRITNVPSACARCGCSHLVPLRGVPVIELESVTVGTRRLSLLHDVALMDYSWLSLGKTTSCWGSCGDVTVSYTYGSKPPALGRMAARELANQFLWYAADDVRCAIPERVTSVSREGVSWTLLDPQDFLENGRTGIYTVDLFLKAVNPERRRMRSRVFSPDINSGKTRR